MNTTKSCKVLVVEDEGLIANDIAERLETLGHEVVGIASTAEEALEKASEADIILMDIRIDGEADGVETAALIRERHNVPVIFITAHADQATIDRAKQTGPFGYLVKPLAPAALNTSIEIALFKHASEKRLEERESLLRTTLASVGDAVILSDALGRILMMNHIAEKLTGWIQPDAAGRQTVEIVRLIDAVTGEAAEDPLPLAILRDQPAPLDRAALLVSQSGRQYSIEGCSSPVRAGGETLGTVLTFRDVTARRWEENQMRQAQRLAAAGKLAARVSTDFTSALGLIRGRADQLLRQFGEYAPAREAAEDIRQAAAATEALTRQLASFGTRDVAEPEVLSLNAVLRRLAQLIESVCGDRAQVAIQHGAGIGRVRADKNQVEQAVLTLILHACSRVSDHGQILVETSNSEVPYQGQIAGYVCLSITYQGNEPDIENLFEPGTSEEAGFGLAIVHGIVTENRGYLQARAAEDGICTIEVLLPRVSGDALIPRPATTAPTVLLIDYRDGVRSQLHNFFEANGYNLLEATDATEALALASVHDGSVHILVAEAPQAEALAAALSPSQPSLKLLKIVDRPATSLHEIRRPFPQAVLLERVEAILALTPLLESASA
jgi:two-component system cell cycle sensor histidine kinase/response regulator CckA